MRERVHIALFSLLIILAVLPLATSCKNEAVAQEVNSIAPVETVQQDSVSGDSSQLITQMKQIAVQDLQTVNKQLQQRLQFTTGSVTMILVIVAMLVFLVFNGRWNRRLEIKNRQLKRERNLVIVQNKQLEVERDRAEAASKAKTAFIQSMTHEIRTPLNAISGFTQILAIPDMQLPDEERLDISKRIQESTRLLTSILDDLIQISDLDSSSELPPAVESHPTEIIEKALDNVRPSILPDVKLEKDCDVPDGMVINTHPHMILSALDNLLGNAAKFTHIGSITLSLHQTGKNLCFTVKDTGPGIPADKREFIFERFAKLDSFVQGTGLGLSVARLIAERLGGSLTLDNDYTNGAKFDFIIPIA